MPSKLLVNIILWVFHVYFGLYCVFYANRTSFSIAYFKTFDKHYDKHYDKAHPDLGRQRH